MKLYADPISTTSRPVLFMAAHAGIELPVEPISLIAGETRAPAFLAINPMGKVPVLEDDGFVLTECAAILRYLAARYAPALYPADTQERARVDEAISLIGSDVYTALAIMTVYPQAFGPRDLSPGAAAELVAFAAPQVERAMKVLNGRLVATAFTAGEALTIADFLALAYLTVADLISYDFSRWPAIGAWIARMQSLDGWADSYATFNRVVASRGEQADR